ncbi:MAG: M28 family peptidase [Gemmatimonadota bacterium]
MIERHALPFRFAALLLLAGLGSTACGAPDDRAPAGEPGTESAVERIPASTLDELSALARATYEGDQVEANADTLIDQIGPRISALASGEEAQAFVARRLRAYGLPRVWEEPFPLLAWDRRDASIRVVAPEGVVGDEELSILSLGHVDSHSVEGPLLDAGYGTAEELEALGDQVAGAIVLADVGSPSGYGRGVHRTEKVSLATAAGAIGFIQLNTAEGPLIPVGVATLGDESTEIPAAAVDRATGEALRAALASEDEVRVELELENWMERGEAANVLGDIPGRGDEIILVGAHLDTWDLGTGALDNGSGTLAVLEVARALAAHVEETGETPLRTIRFAFWMGEELGLYGSRYHVATRVADGELDRYRAILNLDVVGAPVGLGAMGRPEAAPFLEEIRAAIVEAGIPLDDEISTGGGLYSDHQPFLMEGIPIVGVRSRQRPEASGTGHTIADVRGVIDEDGLARSAAVSAALLWALATHPDPGLQRWPAAETGEALEALGVRDPLERAGEWRW